MIARPTLSISVSILALFCLAATISTKYLPEPQSIQTFFVFAPATIVFAILGYLLGASSAVFKNSQAAISGYLISGGILLVVAATLIAFAL